MSYDFDLDDAALKNFAKYIPLQFRDARALTEKLEKLDILQDIKKPSHEEWAKCNGMCTTLRKNCRSISTGTGTKCPLTIMTPPPTPPCDFSGGTNGKESACNAGEPSLILGLGRSPGEGHGKPPQCSCLEDSRDKGAWQATVYRVAKSWTRLSDFTSSLLLSTLHGCLSE